jgi:hypothetical protein
MKFDENKSKEFFFKRREGSRDKSIIKLIHEYLQYIYDEPYELGHSGSSKNHITKLEIFDIDDKIMNDMIETFEIRYKIWFAECIEVHNGKRIKTGKYQVWRTKQ